MERAWAAPPTSVHRGNSLTCRNEEPKLSPSARGSSSSPGWGQAPGPCQPGRTCVHSSSGTHPPSRSCRAAAERHKVQGSPPGCVGLGTTRGFVPLRVQQSHSIGFGIPGQAGGDKPCSGGARQALPEAGQIVTGF